MVFEIDHYSHLKNQWIFVLYKNQVANGFVNYYYIVIEEHESVEQLPDFTFTSILYNDCNDKPDRQRIGFFKDNGPDVIRTRDPRHVKAVS
jgi:hypothetical protein